MADAYIFISSKITPVSTAHDIQVIQDYVTNAFKANGWRLHHNITMVGNELYIPVWGSTSDNLATVARVAENQLKALGLSGISNVQAILVSGAPQQSVSNSVSYNQWTIRADINFDWLTTLWSYDDGKEAIESTLRNAGWSVLDVRQTNTRLSPSGAFDIKVQVFSHFNANAILAQMRADLDLIGTVNAIDVVSTSGGTLPQVTINSNQTIPDDTALVPIPTEKDLDYYLKTFGQNLGFSAGGALVGGLVVGGILLFIILKK